jgi:hypothetical protein
MVAADGMTKTIIAQYVNVASGRHRILCCSLCYDLCVIYLAISALVTDWQFFDSGYLGQLVHDTMIRILVSEYGILGLCATAVLSE